MNLDRLPVLLDNLTERLEYERIHLLISGILDNIGNYFNLNLINIRNVEQYSVELCNNLTNQINFIINNINNSMLPIGVKQQLLDLLPNTKLIGDGARICNGHTVIIKRKYYNNNIANNISGRIILFKINLIDNQCIVNYSMYEPHIFLSDHQMLISISNYISFGTWNTMNRLYARQVESNNYKLLSGEITQSDNIRYNKIASILTDGSIYINGLPCVICLQECMKSIYDIVLTKNNINPNCVHFYEHDNGVDIDCNSGGLLTIINNPSLHLINKKPIFVNYIGRNNINKRKLIGAQFVFFDYRNRKYISIINVHLPLAYAKIDLNLIIDNILIFNNNNIAYEYVVGDFNLTKNYIEPFFNKNNNVKCHYIFDTYSESSVDHGFLFIR